MGVFSFVIAAFALGAASSPASAAFADQLCPEATQYVIAMGTMSQKDPPSAIYEAVHATVSAYDTCAKRHLANGNVEPGVHYAYARQSAFSVVEARALLALNRPAEARSVLENARRLASDVYDWRRNLSSTSSDAKDNRPSVYRDAAKDVLDAVNAMELQLKTPSASAAAAATPAH